MKLKTLLGTAVALLAACALAQDRQPIKALKTDDLGTMDVSELLVWHWRQHLSSAMSYGDSGSKRFLGGHHRNDTGRTMPRNVLVTLVESHALKA